MSRTWRGIARTWRGKKWFPSSGAARRDFGLRFENRFEIALEEMVEERDIDRYVHYPPGTPEKDFQIVRGRVEIEMNITCSQRAWKDHYERFGNRVAVLYVSPWASKETIKDTVRHMFQK